MSELFKNLRTSFLAGLIAAIPLAASLGILLWIFNTVTNWVLPSSLRAQHHAFLYRLVALAVVVALVTTLGWATRKVAGKRFLIFAEALVARLPLFNRIYSFMREISHTLLAGQKTVFARVVLVEYPRPGVYAIGFVTSETEGEVQAKTQARVINVFVPTTPNPTSGFLLMVPREQTINLDMSVADGMKVVISGGAVVPPYPPLSSAPKS